MIELVKVTSDGIGISDEVVATYTDSWTLLTALSDAMERGLIEADCTLVFPAAGPLYGQYAVLGMRNQYIGTTGYILRTTGEEA